MIRNLLILGIGLCGMASAVAQEESESFFTDPSLLEPWEYEAWDVVYLREDALNWTRNYDSVMVDQPEVFVSPDSKYKGAKGDHLKTLADAARLSVIERLEAGGWGIVEEPGPNVVYIRWALDDIYLKKKKRSILTFTPIGMVVHATAQATVRDVWKKIDVNEISLQIEWIDSTTDELLSAARKSMGHRKSKGQKADLVSWEELYALFYTTGEQTRCYMDNNKRPEAEWVDCEVIIVEPEPEED